MKLTTSRNLTELALQRIENALAGEKIVLCLRDRLTLGSFAWLPVIRPHLVAAVTTTQEAKEEAKAQFATFLISDDIPEAGSGIELLHAHKHLKTVLFTERENEATVREAEAAGIDAVIFKSQIGEDGSGALVQGFERVSKGGIYLPESVRKTVGQADPESFALISYLSSKEREVLHGVGSGLDNEEIASKMIISLETVKTHLKNIRQKTGQSDRVKLALLAIRAGI